MDINNRCPLRIPHERRHLSPFSEQTDNVMGDMAEIMKKNGSEPEEAPSGELGNHFPRDPPAQTPKGEQPL